MENFNRTQDAEFTILGSGVHTQQASKTFMANVFLWMFIALGVSSLFAFLFASSDSLLQLLIAPGTDGRMHMTIFGWVVIFAPIAFVLYMSVRLNKLSYGTLVTLFLLYSAVTGISLSFILLAYTSGSVLTCFAAASAMFGVMALLGYTTNQDLTSFGRILQMALIGIIIAIVINMFMGSQQLDYIISIIGVAVFTGLAAYDVQVLKRIGAGIEYEGVAPNDSKKLAIMGALRLYLDFINLFLMLLRLFGRRNN